VSNHQRGRQLCLRVLQLLTEEREKRKITKFALAQKSGVSPQMIGYIEKGERNPTLEIVCRLAAALEVDLSKLVRRAEQETSMPKTE
jgi:transcriptional regulator with XRE-family HTH domain